MEENISENPDREGISLFSPDEEMELLKTSFEGQPRMVPDLGPVVLWGEQSHQYGPGDMGIAVITNQVMIRPAQDLQAFGLYDTNIHIQGLPIQENPILVTLRLKIAGGQQLILEENLGFGEDELEEDPQFRYHAGTGMWNRPGDQQKYIFFARKDPLFLSRLRFSFSSEFSPNNPHETPDVSV